MAVSNLAVFNITKNEDVRKLWKGWRQVLVASGYGSEHKIAPKETRIICLEQGTLSPLGIVLDGRDQFDPQKRLARIQSRFEFTSTGQRDIQRDCPSLAVYRLSGIKGNVGEDIEPQDCRGEVRVLMQGVDVDPVIKSGGRVLGLVFAEEAEPGEMTAGLKAWVALRID